MFISIKKRSWILTSTLLISSVLFFKLKAATINFSIGVHFSLETFQWSSNPFLPLNINYILRIFFVFNKNQMQSINDRLLAFYSMKYSVITKYNGTK